MKDLLTKTAFVYCTLAPGAGAQATWTDRTTAATPRLGMDFASAFDERRGVLVVFGGRDETPSSSGVTNTQLEWDGAVWQSRAMPRPEPRYRHDMVFDALRGVIVLHGGLDPAGRSGNTWEYDGTSWTLRHTDGQNESRFNHRMVFDAARGVVMRYGGFGAGGLRSDTHVWSGSSWQLLAAGGPPAREQHMMAYDAYRQRVVLFGGWGGNGPLGDTWEWNGTSWQQQFPPTSPAPRRKAGMSYTGSSRKIALFGGYDATWLTNDTWTFDGHTWTQLTPATSPIPMAYFELDLDTARDRVVLLRGQEFGVIHIGHWELDAPLSAPASYVEFGSGCASSAGLPHLIAAPGSLPFVGNPFTLELRDIPMSLFHAAFLTAGFSRTHWNGTPLPIDLTAAGMPGCLAWIEAATTELLASQTGVATKTWTIPATTTLVGVEFHVQGAVLDPGINAASFVLSNAGTVRIGQV